jgi:hypothetical protein
LQLKCEECRPWDSKDGKAAEASSKVLPGKIIKYKHNIYTHRSDDTSYTAVSQNKTLENKILV